MSRREISGVYAAVVTPRHADESVDTVALTTVLHFLQEHGVSGFALNGATGEYCLTTPHHLEVILRTACDAGVEPRKILCGVGAPGVAGAVELVAIAERYGVQGLLLPTPFFFPYQQEDLEIFCRSVAASTELPTLLYNLPQFTSGLDKETVLRLIQEVPNIVGIKDSSGSLEILGYLQSQEVAARKIIGNDSVLASGLLAGLCDAVVSGVACALPEVVSALYGATPDVKPSEFQSAAASLDQFIQQLEAFPTPWGLKWALQARGVVAASFSQPVTAHRQVQAEQMIAWMRQWLPIATLATETAGR